MGKFDREKFNSDPKHEEERNQFDVMVEDSLRRAVEKKKKEDPQPQPTQKGFLDEFIDGIFGRTENK